MNSSLMTSMTQCAFGDWVGIVVIVAVGLFSLTFLAVGAALLARTLVDSFRRRNTGAA